MRAHSEDGESVCRGARQGRAGVKSGIPDPLSGSLWGSHVPLARGTRLLMEFRQSAP